MTRRRSDAGIVALPIAGDEPKTPALFARRLLEDLDRDDGRFGDIFWHGSPGNVTTAALRRLRSGADPAADAHPDAGGNGAAMRAHPVGFLTSRDQVLALSARQARVTRGHPAALAAAMAVSVLVYDALHGVEPSNAVPAGIEDAEFAQAWCERHQDLTSQGLHLPAQLRDIDMAG